MLSEQPSNIMETSVEETETNIMETSVEGTETNIMETSGEGTETNNMETSVKETETKQKTRKNLPKPVTNFLKAWLIEHKHHPYPDDTEKQEMSRNLALNPTQLNNWFINNRRRFLKKAEDADERAKAESAKTIVFKHKKGVKRLNRKKRQNRENKMHSSSSFSPPGTSMSRGECQSSDTPESPPHYSTASIYSSPRDRLYLCHLICDELKSNYPFSNELAFLADVTLVRDQLEKQCFIDVNGWGSN